MMVLLRKKPSLDPATASLDQESRWFADFLRPLHEESPAESGKIAGIPFIKSGFTGNIVLSGKSYTQHAVAWVGMTPDAAIVIVAVDHEPDHAKSLAVLSAAAASFRTR
ncbi:MAG: hypothetical protein ABFC96_05655 [Thermoguttaceae bacterium]